jgi:hypothetical protein
VIVMSNVAPAAVVCSTTSRVRASSRVLSVVVRSAAEMVTAASATTRYSRVSPAAKRDTSRNSGAAHAAIANARSTAIPARRIAQVYGRTRNGRGIPSR